MIEKDIVMLVIASRGDRYDTLINNYWSKMIKYIKNKNLSIKVYLIFGNNVKTDDLDISNDDKLILNVKETYIPGILIKTLYAFNEINKMYNYKHIIRTNLSSFFILDNLIKTSNNLPVNNIYGGVIGHYNGIEYISGACFWLSKDMVNYLLNIVLNNNKMLDIRYIDDVAIGKLLIRQPKLKLPRYDLTSNIEIQDKNGLLNNIINEKHYHIRVKSNVTNIDMAYMNKFTEILYKL